LFDNRFDHSAIHVSKPNTHLRPEDEEERENNDILEFLAGVSGHCDLEQSLDPREKLGVHISMGFL
jgi:hypothetical protein